MPAGPLRNNQYLAVPLCYRSRRQLRYPLNSSWRIRAFVEVLLSPKPLRSKPMLPVGGRLPGMDWIFYA